MTSKIDSIIKSKYSQVSQYASFRLEDSSVKDFYRNNIEMRLDGFVLKNRKNTEIDIIVNKGSYLNVLFSNFRSDCTDKVLYFSGYVPVFIEPSYDFGDLSLISSSKLLINGMLSSSMLFLFGNKYELRVPASFGEIGIEDTSGGVVYFVKDSNKNFNIVEIYSSKTDDYFFNIKFSNCPLLKIKCKFIYYKNFDYSLSQSLHPLCFYDFEVKENRWSLSCPESMTVKKIRKTQYNVYNSSGSVDCFEVNGFESPIFIFKYDKKYVIKNNEKNLNPFYFDFSADGMFKNPYNDFENDINTHREELNILFSSNENRNSLSIDPVAIARGAINGLSDNSHDPYYNLETIIDKLPSYDSDNIFYCSSTNSYFGNRVFIGNIGLKEIIGNYGMSSPDSKKFYFDKIGTYYINDLFYHSSGRYFKVQCVELDSVLSPSKKTIEFYGIGKNELNSFFQEENSKRVYLIGDLFSSISELSEASFYESFYSEKKYIGNILVVIPGDILDFSSSIGREYLNSFSRIHSKNSVMAEEIEDHLEKKFNTLINKIKFFLYNNMATTVGLEIE
jgi:hypothetical protein